MKLINKDQSAVYLQKRDVKYLAEVAGIKFFDAYARDVTYKNEGEFIRLEGKHFADCLRFREDIIDYFDYLRMDINIDTLYEQVELAGETYSLTNTIYEKKKRRNHKDITFYEKQQEQAHYQYRSLQEMLLDKLAFERLSAIPFKLDENPTSYHKKTGEYLGVATDVEGVYVFLDQRGQKVSAKDKSFMSFVSREKQQILVDASHIQESKKQTYHVQLKMPQEESVVYLIVHPIKEDKLYRKER